MLFILEFGDMSGDLAKNATWPVAFASKQWCSFLLIQ